MVAKRSARAERVQAVNQARALIMTGPEELRARFARYSPAQLIAAIAAPARRRARVWARVALREPVRRDWFPAPSWTGPGELIGPLVTARAPGLLARPGAGPDTAALLLVAAGITRSGCAAKAHGRTCAASPRSPLRPARPLAGAGTAAAATGRPTARCGRS